MLEYGFLDDGTLAVPKHAGGQLSVDCAYFIVHKRLVSLVELITVYCLVILPRRMTASYTIPTNLSLTPPSEFPGTLHPLKLSM